MIWLVLLVGLSDNCAIWSPGSVCCLTGQAVGLDEHAELVNNNHFSITIIQNQITKSLE